MPYRFKSISLIVIAIFLSLVPYSTYAAGPHYEKSVHNFVIPDIVLVDQNREKVRLKSLLESDQIVIVDFIFATCTTICPVLSVSYTNLQKRLGEDQDKVQLVSITIDPENDTPEVLNKYLQHYQGQPGWLLLTGSRPDINRAMNAFDSFFRDKMDHKPVTFIRNPKNGSWTRLYGLISGRDFLAELKNMGT